jgi:hypothetical protein
VQSWGRERDRAPVRILNERVMVGLGSLTDTFLPRRRVLSSLLPPHAREQPSAAAAKAVAAAMCRYSDTRARQLQQTVVADRVYCGVALAAFLPHCP